MPQLEIALKILRLQIKLMSLGSTKTKRFISSAHQYCKCKFIPQDHRGRGREKKHSIALTCSATFFRHVEVLVSLCCF